MTLSALLVADYLLASLPEYRYLTNLSIIKLVFMSHGWTLGLTGKPLISEPVEAWKYGPVIPALYHRFKEYGYSPIDRLGYSGTPLADRDKVGRQRDFISGEMEDDERSIIEQTYEKYGDLTAPQLSNLTHEKGTPWRRYYRLGRSAVIPNDVIRQYYASRA